jgi:sensor histidine kinase YesM
MKKDFLFRILRQRWLQHLLFWGVAWYLLLHLFASSSILMPIDYIYTSVFLVTIALSVAINLFILIPLFLARQHYLLYGFLLSLSVALFAWLNMLTFSRFIDYILPGYYFISYYNYGDLLKFFVAFTLITTLLKLSKGWFLLMDARNKLARLEKEHTQAALDTLKGQINPHFLFNSLNTLYSLVLKKSETAPEMILKLSGFLRYLLYETSAGRVDLAKEISYMKDYVELQKLRSGDQASIRLQVTGEPVGKQIAPLLFLPLVENSFKHGIKGETGRTFVNILFAIGVKEIEFTASNNKGFTDVLPMNETHGIGLDNLRKRLEYLYPGNFILETRNEENAFFVKLIVPLQDEAEIADHRG